VVYIYNFKMNLTSSPYACGIRTPGSIDAQYIRKPEFLNAGLWRWNLFCISYGCKTNFWYGKL